VPRAERHLGRPWLKGVPRRRHLGLPRLGRPTGSMKLIVGLGNIGRKYENTRHNVGFNVLELLAKRNGAAPSREKFEGRTQDATIGSERVLLLWPHTLMNLSGRSVQAAMKFYQLPLDDLLVVSDDFNLPLGKLRLRSQGSAGGQNGLDDIINRLGSNEFSRLRVGIGTVPDNWDAADFVLGKFGPSDRAMIDETIGRAAEAVECWVKEGIAAAMNQYNG
jgi:PTH1 family peptidyl-tRNA hydrolase